jgi:hypothetical protein
MTGKVPSSGRIRPKEVKITGIIDGAPRIHGVRTHTEVRMIVVESGGDKEPPPGHQVRTHRSIGQKIAALVRSGTLTNGVEVTVSGIETRKPSSDRGTPPKPVVRAKDIQSALSE